MNEDDKDIGHSKYSKMNTMKEFYYNRKGKVNE